MSLYESLQRYSYTFRQHLKEEGWTQPGSGFVEALHGRFPDLRLNDPKPGLPEALRDWSAAV